MARDEVKLHEPDTERALIELVPAGLICPEYWFHRVPANARYRRY
jgi:hypothetical protein